MLDLKEKTLLVSIRHAGKMPAEDFYEFYIADVITTGGNTVMVRRRRDGKEVSLPFVEDAFIQLEPGFYELRDGSTCTDPSYELRLTRYASRDTWNERAASDNAS